MKIVYHHHMTTTVQKTDEIDRMLAMTDPKYVSMIYDTGHLTFSGEDPIEILKKHHDRIGHVHLKNVRKPAMDKCYAENKSFLRSIPEGVFTVPSSLASATLIAWEKKYTPRSTPAAIEPFMLASYLASVNMVPAVPQPRAPRRIKAKSTPSAFTWFQLMSP